MTGYSKTGEMKPRESMVPIGGTCQSPQSAFKKVFGVDPMKRVMTTHHGLVEKYEAARAKQIQLEEEEEAKRREEMARTGKYIRPKPRLSQMPLSRKIKDNTRDMYPKESEKVRDEAV